MKKNFPSLVKEIDFQEAHEAQRVQKKLDPRRITSRHIIVKLSKIKEKETVIYKGGPIKLSADFPKETLQARRGWKEVFKS